jgi:class 3 adenylate cyclase/predicted ATPase
MTFDDILTQVTELLQQQGRVSYGALKRRFALTDDYLQDLKDELIDAQQLAVDEDERVLVWVGNATVASSQLAVASCPPSALQTPNAERQIPHLSFQTLDPKRRDSRLNVAERRQLTVMFCDLVDSTALSTQLDPEELRAVVQTYQAIGAEAIERYDGYIAQYLGDGMLVYFGYPVAHEDDGQRAVRAGLDMLRALQRYNRHPRSHGGPSLGVSLRVRIGIHTGLVVVGEMGGGGKYEQLALGETPNIAARVQGVAAPDSIAISVSTYRLVAGTLTCRSLGPQTFKGVPQPVEIFQVEGDKDLNMFSEVGSGKVPLLVGRTEEAEFLQRRWERVKERQGQVVLLSGEPGIGKSRLVRNLREYVAEQELMQLEMRCSPYHQNSALHPVIEFFQRMLQIQPEEAPEFTLKKLEGILSFSRVDESQTLPFLAALLSLPPTRFPLPALTPQKQKEKTFQAILAWLLQITARQHVLLVWEDLHWADPSTLEFLGLLIEQTATTSMFVVLTARPEFVPPWPTRSHVTSLMLSRLGKTHVEAMVKQATGEKPLPAEVLQQIVAKTDGVPLFVEELTAMVLESGLLRETQDRYELTGPLPPLAIPATLQDSLFARLDRLGAAREVAQLAATVGREFSYELIHIVSSLQEETLQQALAKLTEAEVLYQRGIGAQAHYSFKHALIQEAAYQSLLKSRRQQYHLQIAQALEAHFAETATTQPELIAYHYTEAGLSAQALPYWRQAGQAALQRSANQEAIGHLSKALAVLQTLPESEDLRQMEVALQVTLGVPLMMTKGYAAPEVEQTFARAWKLCHSIGETPQLFPALSGLFAFYLVTGDLATARDLAEQCLQLAEKARDAALLIEAHRMLANVLLFFGEPATALIHTERALALYDRQQHRTLAFVSGQDPAVVCLSFTAWGLQLLGYPNQAAQRSEEAVVWARELGHANSLGFALALAARSRGYIKDWEGMRTRAEETIALANEQGLVFWEALCTLYQGWALSGLGQYEEGLTLMRRGIAAYWATGAMIARSGNLYVLAEGCGQVGQIEEGLQLIAEGFTMVKRNGEHAWESELYRVKGDLLLQQQFQVPSSKFQVENPQSAIRNPQLEAEACFLKAIEIAQHQQEKLYEMRTLLSLVKLWHRQGKTREAYQRLSELYQWFTEGFETADLQEARMLLDTWKTS